MSEQGVVSLVIEPREKDLGEFTVRRALPDKRRQRIGPFIFFDHMGPADFPPGTGVNVRAHPHIGLATITYLFEGEMLHRDSLGYVQVIRPGAVNWMTAGKGIVHSEKVRPEVLASGQHLHGIQIWVALPLESEEIDPRFEHYPASDIPQAEIDGVAVRVIIGNSFGLESPVRAESETLYVELDMPTGTAIELPAVDELGVYVVDGEAVVADTTLGAGKLAALEHGSTATVTANRDSKVMLCGGETLAGERFLWWNFVSSSRQRLEQAKNDWRDGRFDEVPGETDFIPLPTK